MRTIISLSTLFHLLVAGIFLFPASGECDDFGEGKALVGISCPDGVNHGDAFICKVTSDNEIIKLKVNWLDKDFILKCGSDGHEQPVGNETDFLLGAGLKVEIGKRRVRVEVHTLKGIQRAETYVEVIKKSFAEERLTLPGKMVFPDKKDHARIGEEARAVGMCLAKVSPFKAWKMPFVRPVTGELSTSYGLRRVLNGVPRQPHRGVDFRGASGDPVRAAADGVVDMAVNHYFTGKSLFVDHGQGVVSVYFHLSRMLVGEGDKVKAGDVIGEVGSTGRSTGPHLHFGVSVLRQLVNPMPFFSEDGAFGDSKFKAPSEMLTETAERDTDSEDRLLAQIDLNQ